MRKFQASLILTLLLAIGCSRERTEAELGPEEEFELAMMKFKAKKYGKAVGKFKRIVFRYPTSKWAEESQYRLAKCHFLQKDYSSAKIEYKFFLDNYSRSRFADEAAFEAAVCNFYEALAYYLDPSLTKGALHEFQAFIRKYPDSDLVEQAKKYEQKCIDKLVRKDIETAKLYIKMGKFESAALYLKEIQTNYPSTSYNDEIASLLDKVEKLQKP